MIHRTFRSAPVIRRVQECVAMFRRAIDREAEAHAKAKSESVQGQKKGTRNRRNRKKDFEAELAAPTLKYGPCGVCGKEKDHRLADCPYKEHIPNPLEVTVLDGSVVVSLVGTLVAGAGLDVLLSSFVAIVWYGVSTGLQIARALSPMKLRNGEPEKEEFLDLEPYFRAVQRKDEENEYDA
ncbi:hypothetical protein D8674_025611 [Pyrus ussuriensis x Pyrus communis]|uniref:Uncharacterized protein n=1 Tax=Pyrus ussuriensis x Pyrus communis TaxID=2448454 RepID=A0A5N5I790_9ROSA|nr:hypothetical protein D8674_025611 [Pyrus ussuriensis x Pyrus communis]